MITSRGAGSSPSAALLAGLLALAAPASAQAPSPPPIPPLLLQDELDLLTRSNVVQGSGARAFGMGGAFLARADDATAASWNPAGLSYLALPELSLVWTDSSLRSTVIGSQGAVRERRDGRTPDFASLAYPIRIGAAEGAVQASFQRVISFVSDREIDDPVLDRTIRTSGGLDVLALGTGLRLSRQLRAGVVVNRWLTGYRQNLRRPEFTWQYADFSLAGWNVHTGLIYSPVASLNLGATFKTGFDADVSLLRRRSDDFGGAQTYNSFTSAGLRLNVPQAFGVGASWRLRSNLTLGLDYTRSFWSDARIQNFFTLPRTEPGQDPPPPRFWPALPWPALIEDQHDAKQVRAGGEYVLLLGRLRSPMRVGYYRDRQYFPSASGRPPSFGAVTFGTGLIVGSSLLDVAYVREWGSYLDSRGQATSVRSGRLYASVIYRHRRKP